MFIISPRERTYSIVMFQKNLLAKHSEGHIWVPMTLVARELSLRSLSCHSDLKEARRDTPLEYTMHKGPQYRPPAKVTLNSMKLLAQRIPCGRTRRGGERSKHVRSSQPH